MSFETESDTEVVLEAYRRHGADCLSSLRGMFAFAIWSRTERTLFLARDPFGIKPLYYHAAGGQFAFASELKTLCAILPVERRMSPSGLAALLNYGWLPTDLCILEGFQSVPPAHYMLVRRDGAFRSTRYWSLNAAVIDRPEPEIVEELAETLEQSLAAHLVADVEVGAFLSGGLDSSLLCSMAMKKVGRLRTFTIATDRAAKRVERMPSDEVFARKVSDGLGTTHNEITIRPDIVRDLPKMLLILDEPLGDPAAINTYLMCAEARKAGIKVLLSGMGADEIFFGYRRQKAWLYGARYQAIPAPLRSLIGGTINSLPIRIGQRGLRSVRWAKKFLSFANLEPTARYQSSFSAFSKDGLSDLLHPDWRGGIDRVYGDFRTMFEQRYAQDPVNRMCFVDLNMFLPGLNLAYTDRASMAASTEVRVPYVDTRVIELAMRIPGAYKFKRGQSKHILKRAAERHLPQEIVYRRKASFGMPLRAWISRDLRPMVDDLLSSRRLKQRGWINPIACQRMIDDDRKGRADFSYQLYQLLSLELWAQAMLDTPVANLERSPAASLS